MPEALVFFKHQDTLVIAKRLTVGSLTEEGFRGVARDHWLRHPLYRVSASMENQIVPGTLIAPDAKVKITKINNG